MAKQENPKDFGALSVPDAAELFGVSDRQVRNWIKDKGLPAKSDPRGFTLDWPVALEWYVEYRTAQKGGSARNLRGGNDPLPPETYDQALARRTRAEADLKELQLARESGEVAAIADVERILSAANKSVQTLILALPTALTPRLIGVDDRNQVYQLLDTGLRDALNNLATLDVIRQAERPAPEEDQPAE